jgi:hypothetical protein
MTLFGLLGKKSDAAQVKKWGERAANKRAQAVDRWDAIQQLVNMKSPAAVEALLPRFTFYVDPSITDQEEKELAFEGIIALGEAAAAPVEAFMKRSESISWSMKILDRVLPPERVIETLLTLLAAMDIEYERDPQRKVQILAALEERRAPTIAEQAARFLQDANETVRFHAAGAVLAQEAMDAQRPELLKCFCGEASVRVRSRILDGFTARSWDVTAQAAEVKPKLPPGYSLDRAGIPRRG